MLIPIGDIAPRTRTPVINYLLIGANILVFLLYAIGQQPEEYQQTVISHGLTPNQFEWMDVVTSMFLHAGLLHIFGNMLFLLIAGDNIEDRFNHLPYLLFYLAGGAAAAGTQMFMSTEAMKDIPMIGASGAISGVIGAYLMLHPKARIKVLISYFLVWLPAYVVLGFWIGFQFFSAAMAVGGAGGGVAWWAHIGGFFAGVALIVPMKRKNVALFDRGLQRFTLKPGVSRRPRIPKSGQNKGRGGPKGPWR